MHDMRISRAILLQIEQSERDSVVVACRVPRATSIVQQIHERFVCTVTQWPRKLKFNYLRKCEQMQIDDVKRFNFLYGLYASITHRRISTYNKMGM